MSTRRIYDISLSIEPDMHVWPGNAPVLIDTVKSISHGDSSNVSLLHIGTHTATHVDAPRHFIPGAPGVDSIAAELLVGPARLLQLTETSYIDKKLLQKIDIGGVTRLLLGSRNSSMFRQPKLDMDYTYVAEDAAHYLVDMGVRLVGIDYLSIEQYKKEGRPTHHTLLSAGVVIIEGLDLTGVPEGDYELICMPLKLKDADGAPARVFLREL